MTEAVPLSEDLLHTMRTAAKKAIELREPNITPRAIILALLEDPAIGPVLAAVVDKEKVRSVTAEDPELPAMARNDTLAFKTPDGRTSVWLSREAYNIFIEGAQRVHECYMPKNLALGLAAQTRQAPGIFMAMRVEPGALANALFNL